MPTVSTSVCRSLRTTSEIRISAAAAKCARRMTPLRRYSSMRRGLFMPGKMARTMLSTVSSGRCGSVRFESRFSWKSDLTSSTSEPPDHTEMAAISGNERRNDSSSSWYSGYMRVGWVSCWNVYERGMENGSSTTRRPPSMTRGCCASSSSATMGDHENTSSSESMSSSR
jgi:hypothetical protein